MPQVTKFTPYTEEEKKHNWDAFKYGTPEQRNPAYAKAKKAAEERKNNKVKITESQLQDIIRESVMHAMKLLKEESDPWELERDAWIDREVKRMIENGEAEDEYDAMMKIFGYRE